MTQTVLEQTAETLWLRVTLTLFGGASWSVTNDIQLHKASGKVITILFNDHAGPYETALAPPLQRESGPSGGSCTEWETGRDPPVQGEMAVFSYFNTSKGPHDGVDEIALWYDPTPTTMDGMVKMIWCGVVESWKFTRMREAGRP